MDLDITAWALPLVSVVIGAVVGAIVSVWRGRAEIRWQSKYDACHRILGALDEIRSWAEETYADRLALPRTPLASAYELSDRYRAAQRELWRVVHAGVLVISSQTRRRLEALLADIAREDAEFHERVEMGDDGVVDHARHADRVGDAVRRGMPGLLEAMRREVGRFF